MSERNITFEIKEHLGVIAEFDNGWNKELNIISWNGNTPKYDIRDWDSIMNGCGRVLHCMRRSFADWWIYICTTTAEKLWSWDAVWKRKENSGGESRRKRGEKTESLQMRTV